MRTLQGQIQEEVGVGHGGSYGGPAHPPPEAGVYNTMEVYKIISYSPLL